MKPLCNLLKLNSLLLVSLRLLMSRFAIAYSKRVRSCTKHLLSNFFFYNSLSTSYRVFFCLYLLCLLLRIVGKPSCFDWRSEDLVKKWDLRTCHFTNGQKLVGCTWVFTLKHKVGGSIQRFKARLVAKGFTQILWS